MELTLSRGDRPQRSKHPRSRFPPVVGPGKEINMIMKVLWKDDVSAETWGEGRSRPCQQPFQAEGTADAEALRWEQGGSVWETERKSIGPAQVTECEGGSPHRASTSPLKGAEHTLYLPPLKNLYLSPLKKKKFCSFSTLLCSCFT